MTVRYDNRTFKFYPDSHTISLTTVHGRLTFPVAHSPMIDKYKGEYTNAQLVVDEKKKRVFIMVQVEMRKKEAIKKRKCECSGNRQRYKEHCSFK